MAAAGRWGIVFVVLVGLIASSAGDSIEFVEADKYEISATSATVLKLKYSADKTVQITVGVQSDRREEPKKFYFLQRRTFPAATEETINYRVQVAKSLAAEEFVELTITTRPVGASFEEATSRQTRRFKVIGGDKGCVPNPSSFPGKQISPLACLQVKVSLPLVLDFSEEAGGITDKNDFGTGFTAYVPSKSGKALDEDLFRVEQNKLLLTGSPGSWRNDRENRIKNALAVGLPLPNKHLQATVRLDVPRSISGSNEQLCLFLAVDVEDYAEVCIISTNDDTILRFTLEDIDKVKTTRSMKLDLKSSRSLALRLDINSNERDVVSVQYRLANRPFKEFMRTVIPGFFTSKDQAILDPIVETRSLCGLLALSGNRKASEPVLEWPINLFSVYDITDKATSTPTPKSTPAATPRAAPADTPKATPAAPRPTPAKKPARRVEADFDTFYIPNLDNAVNVAFAPDGRLYVAQSQGVIAAFRLDIDKKRVLSRNVYRPFKSSRLLLGIEPDIDWNKGERCLWLSHSKPVQDKEKANSGIISKLCGNKFDQLTDVIVGLPTSDSAHATNSIHFGPDRRLYIAQGGNTEFGSSSLLYPVFRFPEQPLSAAILVANVKAKGFKGKCTPRQSKDRLDSTRVADKSVPKDCDVTVFASGFRNIFDFAFTESGRMYGADNAATTGGRGTYPHLPKGWKQGDRCDQPYKTWGEVRQNQPNEREELLYEILQGRYYGHPNPSRDECVAYGGNPTSGRDYVIPRAPSRKNSWVIDLPSYPVGTMPQSAANGMRPWQRPMMSFGSSHSVNGMIIYRGDAFCGTMKGDILTTYFSVDDQVKRLKLSADGRSVVFDEVLRRTTKKRGGQDMNNALGITQDTDGNIYVAEFRGDKVLVLIPKKVSC